MSNNYPPHYFSVYDNTIEVISALPEIQRCLYDRYILLNTRHANETVRIMKSDGILTFTLNKISPFYISPNTSFSFQDIFFILKYFIQITKGASCGIFFHGSCIQIRDSAYVFLGQSGIGKSTIARKSGARILNDDFVILGKSDNKWYVQQSNLDISLTKYQGNNISEEKIPVKGIYFLQQTSQNKIIKISLTTAIEKLLQNSIFYLGFSETKKYITNSMDDKTKKTSSVFIDIMENLFDIATKIPQYQLRSTKNYRFDPRHAK